ncbi:MAG TPA: O-antigen ligase family protein, partial [Acidimicrobiia bacterium]|nr:O-antigen ligase family protein [Acidimicrobiia bacterium]
MRRSRPRVTRATQRLLIVAAGASMPLFVHGQAFAVDDADLGSVGSSTRIAVIGITIILLVAAGFAARSAIRRPTDGGPSVDDDLLDMELLSLGDSPYAESRAMLIFERVFLLVLLGYAVGDRGFAWFHVPGTPLFVGELTLALGVFAMLSSRVPVFSAFRVSPAFRILTFWMSWGLVFLVLQVPTYGFDAIRDSAIWYYGSVTILTVFLMMSDPSRFGKWSRLYLKAIPFLLLWFPVAMVLDYVLGNSPPYAPDSQVSIFDHRHFNMAVLSAMALGFIWLVAKPSGQLTPTQRWLYSAGATVVILVAGFQTRGGFAAAVFGLLLILLFMRGRRAELALVGGAVVVALASIAIIGNISIPISNGREISAAQMMDNLGSIVNPDSGETRQRGTTQWRLELWTAVLDDVITDHPVAGFGPGPNLGKWYGVETNSDVPLRNPHNSHLGVLSRMGLVGIAM